MITRSISSVFAPAIREAKRLEWTHARVRLYRQKEDRLRFINSLFGAGRIDGTAMVMLIDLYVDELQ